MIDRYRTPITLLVDDPCPLIHVYREHWRDVHGKPPETEDGRPLLPIIANSFLDRYCEVMERWGIKGKFSIVPAPAGLGDVVRGIEGFEPALTQEWLATAKRRLGALCDFCPEGITHNLAVDLTAEPEGFGSGTGPITGALPAVIAKRDPHAPDSPPRLRVHPEGESHWSQHQTRETLTPYLIYQLRLLKDAGFDCTGVTSPWVFGIEVEEEYIAAIVAAQREVYGRAFSWYFLHMLWKNPGTRPWIAYREDGATLVAIAATVKDWWWATIDLPRTDAAWIGSITDSMLTEDGERGQIIDVLEAGGWPVLLTHWQSLFSNGLETGLAVLDELGNRIDRHLSDRVQWSTCSDLARLTTSNSP